MLIVHTKSIKNDIRTDPDAMYGFGFYPHPYASANLQVQRVSAIRAQSQLTSSAPLVVIHLV